MADVFTKAKRSVVMSSIRSRGNRQTEMVLAKFLRRSGLAGWRRHRPVFGKPDFIFPRRRLALFVDGCFWHACPRHTRLPVSHRAFWRKKLERNQARDRLVTRTLRARGWIVLRIWQHELAPRKEARLLRRIRSALAAPARKQKGARIGRG
jgi:DNA mismatch endonuclease (patch repair protein)